MTGATQKGRAGAEERLTVSQKAGSPRWVGLVLSALVIVGCGSQKQDTGSVNPGPNSGLESNSSLPDAGETKSRSLHSLDTNAEVTDDATTEAAGTFTTDTAMSGTLGNDPSTQAASSAGDGSTRDTLDSTAQSVAVDTTDASWGENTDAEQPPLQLPAGCDAGQRGESADSCYLNTSCLQASDLVFCSRLDSGRWACHCNFNNTERIYEVDGAEGLDACAAASHYCGKDELELGEDECEPFGDSSENGCHLTLECGRTIQGDATPGARVRVADLVSSGCERTADTDAFDCWCAYDGKETRHRVGTESASNACSALGQFCRGAEATPLDEPEMCVPEHELIDSGSCDRLDTCVTPVAVLQDAVISQVQQRGAHCVASGATSSQCYCSEVDSIFSFEVDAPDNTCGTSILNCGKDVNIEATGTPTCAPTSLTTTYSSCETDLDCTQPATVDGRTLTAVGRLLVYCRQTAFDEPWWCSCASNQESAVFEYGAPEESSWDVCSAAPARCLEHLSIHVGPYGEFVPPVDPIYGRDEP